ncbi:MAG: hypothetical protein IZT55_05925 [Anaerolineae bacterium]|nr:hypothetical protein [Anaerolineae bacterium]
MKESAGRTRKYIVGTIGLIVLVLLVISFNRRMIELRKLSEQADFTSAQVTALVLTQENLTTQITVAASDEAVEAWAYNEARWIREGDHLIAIIPLNQDKSEPIISAQGMAPTPVENWQVWRTLFLDQSSP